jgi:chromosome segregation ATPase
MASEARETLEKRAQKAILNNAFFRWESAGTIALTLILASLATLLNINPEFFIKIPLDPWIWLLAGGVLEGLLVYSSLSDSEQNRQVVAKMLKDEFHPERLTDKKLQEQIQEALDYRSRITTAIRERRESVLKDNLSATASQIDEWLESIYNLAQRLDRYQQEKNILERDKKRATARINELKQKLSREDDSAVRGQIETTTSNLQRQYETILQLENTMERAELQLETTLSSLGTIYSQTMLVGAKDIDSGRAKRLRQEISEEVQELDNILIAMDEVYASGG